MARNAELPYHVFLVDDNEDDLELFNITLQELDVPVLLTTVSDSTTLFDTLRREPLPDVVFLDLNMPLKSGFECLEELRQSEEFKHLPVVVFTTAYQPEFVQRALENRADFYIRKPWEQEALKHCILCMLGVEWDETLPDKDRFYFDFQQSDS